MMTETMRTADAGSRLRPTPSAPRRVRAALAAEWIKLRSLRSMLRTPAFTAFVCIGLAASVCANAAGQWSRWDAASKASFNPLDTNYNFLLIAPLFFATLGAIVVTNEYGSGLIRMTLAATPQRELVLAAKTALLILIALVTSAVVCLAAFFTGQALLSGHAPSLTLGDPGVLGKVLGAVYWLTAASVIGLFIGVLARSTAAAMSCVFAVLLVIPILVDKLPHGALWQRTAPYMPSNLGESLFTSAHVDGLTSATVAAIVLPLYVIVLGVLAVLSLRRRDA